MGLFTDNEIFNDPEVNRISDLLMMKTADIIFFEKPLIVCGSVSRIFAGENLVPKDLDFVTFNESTFWAIQSLIDKWLPGYDISKSEKRIVIFTKNAAIEIWNGKSINGSTYGSYKGIPYVISNRMKKVRNEHQI